MWYWKKLIRTSFKLVINVKTSKILFTKKKILATKQLVRGRPLFIKGTVIQTNWNGIASKKSLKF